MSTIWREDTRIYGGVSGAGRALKGNRGQKYDEMGAVMVQGQVAKGTDTCTHNLARERRRASSSVHCQTHTVDPATIPQLSSLPGTPPPPPTALHIHTQTYTRSPLQIHSPHTHTYTLVLHTHTCTTTQYPQIRTYELTMLTRSNLLTATRAPNRSHVSRIQLPFKIVLFAFIAAKTTSSVRSGTEIYHTRFGTFW